VVAAAEQLLDQHDQAFAAFIAKYPDNALPKGPVAAPAPRASSAVPLGANAPAAKLMPTGRQCRRPIHHGCALLPGV
jgi:hypothetical protein